MVWRSRGVLPPIAESPLKESAAERGEDVEMDEEEEEDMTLESGDLSASVSGSGSGSDDEELLLSADALGRRMQSAHTRGGGGGFQMLPLEVEGPGGSSVRGSSPYLIVRTEEPPLAANEDAPRNRPPSRPPSSSSRPSSSSSSSSSRRPPSPSNRQPTTTSTAYSRVLNGILSSPIRGGVGDHQCPFPPPFDEEHPDPCECLCNLLRVPRVPHARTHYLLHRSPSTGRIYAVGPHWAGLCFTLCLVCVASGLFIRNVCRPLGAGYVATACVYTVLTLLTLLRTALLDPGFVTRSVPESEFPRRRYCRECRLYTAPDAAHCDDCKACVDRCDHHCPWTGHCIGRGNMGAFLAFNCTWITYVLFVLASLAVQNGLLFGAGKGGGGVEGQGAPVAPADYSG